MGERMKKSPPIWLGGIAASMAACFTHPLDLTKVRMQTLAKSLSGTTRVSTLTVIRLTIAESGIRSLYTGLTASLLRQMSYSMVRLGTYEEMKRRLLEDGTSSTGKLLLAASFAGGLGGIAGNPADILLVRMTTDQLRPPESKYNYSNALSGLVNLVRNEGIKGLFRGVGTNTVRAVLMNSSQVASYDYFKSYLLHHRLPIIDYQFHDNLLLHSSASLMAGTVATTVCSPADVIKSRIMSASERSSPIEILKRSLREEGPTFLFKGWTPAFIRLGPNTVLLFVFLEQLRNIWRQTMT